MSKSNVSNIIMIDSKSKIVFLLTEPFLIRYDKMLVVSAKKDSKQLSIYILPATL